MKKKLVLVLATLMCISLCACGGSESTSGDNNSEIKQENSTEVINGLTGEKEEIKDTQTNEKTMVLYAKVIEVNNGTTIDGSTERIKFEFSLNDIVSTFGDEYPVDTFEVGNVVKFTVGVRNYGGPDLPDTDNVISWEIQE